ncbi:MAG: hypothetical protein IBJ00_01130 [Alphaproteobacteria bacterium]|nr:hypothetical protein [Alphaproteobacteria bacterium]
MKRILASLIFAMGLLVNEEAFSSDYFDIDAASGSIVAKLWSNVEVPEQNILELFGLIEKSQNNKSKKDPTKDEVRKITDDDGAEKINFINTWGNLARQSSQADGEDSKAIDQFINSVTKLHSKYLLDTIKDSLSIILEKY